MSGFRLYSTTNYRPMEFGIITVGSTSDQSGILIPPYTSNYSLEFDCQMDCTNVIQKKTFLTNSNVKFIG